uniref:ARAD1D07744p n=1 Tax=Blastobotrys adeninivorans TaxID=409370 RepID=A0A060T919_BLAAD
MMRAAYRSLYRHGMRAFQYRGAEAHTYKQVLRERFEGPRLDVSERTLARTIEFVKNAEKQYCLEYAILARIVHSEYSRLKLRRPRQLSPTYTATIEGLNKTMDLCL